ncbi:MAG: VOC family protein [Pseudomonadota bacterium]
MPFVPAGIDHLVIWVGNLEAASTWYQDVLGCRPAYAYPEIAMVHLWHGPVLIGLWDAGDPRAAYAAPATAGGQNVHHIAFSWQGASETVVRDHLRRNGVELIRAARQVGSRGFGLALYFRDPWGNLIELKGPPTYQPPEPASCGDPSSA